MIFLFLVFLKKAVKARYKKIINSLISKLLKKYILGDILIQVKSKVEYACLDFNQNPLVTLNLIIKQINMKFYFDFHISF